MKTSVLVNENNHNVNVIEYDFLEITFSVYFHNPPKIFYQKWTASLANKKFLFKRTSRFSFDETTNTVIFTGLIGEDTSMYSFLFSCGIGSSMFFYLQLLNSMYRRKWKIKYKVIVSVEHYPFHWGFDFNFRVPQDPVLVAKVLF